MKIKHWLKCDVRSGGEMQHYPACGSNISNSLKGSSTATSTEERKAADKPLDFMEINQRISMQNNQNTIVKRLLAAAGIFAILTILPFTEWEPFSQVWGLALVSFFLFISSLTIAWMFRNRSQKLQTLISGESLLAEWMLSPEEKEAYADYLFTREQGKNFAILTVISVMAIVIFGIFILVIDDGKLFMLATLAGLIVFTSLFAIGMPYYYRHTNRKGDGRVLIGAKYAYVNGYFHNWDFPFSGLSRIKIINKPFNGIDLIYYYTDRTLRHSEELAIPVAKDVDLEALLEKMKILNKK